MRNIVFQIVLVITGLWASHAGAQGRRVDTLHVQRLVLIGDTVLIKSYPPLPGTGDPDCQCDAGWFGTDGADGFLTSKMNLYFVPTQYGEAHTVVGWGQICSETSPGHMTCGQYSLDDSELVIINAVFDSIRAEVPTQHSNPQVLVESIFSAEINFKFEQSVFMPVTLHLCNVTGRLVLSSERACPSGSSEISLDATSLPAGCYWYVLRGRTMGAEDWMRSGKVIKLDP